MFGDPEEPGALRTFLGYLLNRRNSYVKVGETVSLADVNAMNAGALIPNLDADACVEVPGMVDGLGVHPVAMVSCAARATSRRACSRLPVWRAVLAFPMILGSRASRRFP